MAKRLIDAEALDKVIEFYQAGYSPVESRGNAFMYKALSAVRKMVADAPTVDAVVPVHAGWLKDRDTIKCSVCGFGMFRAGYYFRNGECFSSNDGKFTPSYCPSCGAIMDGEKESEAK